MPGIWRYWNLLSLSNSKYALSLGEASALPIRAARLARLLNVADLWLLPYSANPSGTFKDLEAAFVISKCLECNLDNLCWHSTGNTARAYRLYATYAGLRSTTFVPLTCAGKLVGITSSDKAAVIAYDGSFQDISALAKDYSKQKGLLHIAPLWWKIEGKAVMAYQIAEFIPHTSLVVQTIAGGYGFLGLTLGFDRLARGGLRSGKPPRCALFQISDADSIAQLFAAGYDSQLVPADLKLARSAFEPTLQSTNPMATYLPVKKAVERTGSRITSVTPADTERYASEFEDACSELGVRLCWASEKSPFISWAGLRKAQEFGHLDPHENVCLIVTGAPQAIGDAPEFKEVRRA